MGAVLSAEPWSSTATVASQAFSFRRSIGTLATFR
jgi:hypothetical protein